jgi:hypothetical protein
MLVPPSLRTLIANHIAVHKAFIMHRYAIDPFRYERSEVIQNGIETIHVPDLGGEACASRLFSQGMARLSGQAKGLFKEDMLPVAKRGLSNREMQMSRHANQYRVHIGI